jgi:hypothetical protein
MKRVIFSIYIDIPSEELDWQPPYSGETESKNDKTKRELAKHYQWLTDRQQQYANHIGVDYVQFLNDAEWEEFRQSYRDRYPFITAYNIVNFYKIHLMYKLSLQYDEILYMDLDVVPMTTDNFFEVWDLTQGVAILKNDAKVNTSILTVKNNNTQREQFNKPLHSIRSPVAKYWNCYALLANEGYHPIPDVYNTGIVGITKQQLNQLDYFGDFDYMLKLMSDLKTDPDSMYPQWIQEIFGWDNETIWGFKMASNNVEKQWLDDEWHYFMDRGTFIPSKIKIIHVINKEFAAVRNWYEKNRL